MLRQLPIEDRPFTLFVREISYNDDKNTNKHEDRVRVISPAIRNSFIVFFRFGYIHQPHLVRLKDHQKAGLAVM